MPKSKKQPAAQPVEDHGKSQAIAQYESIKEMVLDLRMAEKSGTDEAREEAREAIEQDPLSVEVRSDWHTVGNKEGTANDFRILLCWGGPACQIIGELDEHNQPESAKLQYQDWGTPWTDYHPDYDSEASEDDQPEAILLEYARAFYFGE